jgi:hypothetical protein
VALRVARGLRANGWDGQLALGAAIEQRALHRYTVRQNPFRLEVVEWHPVELRQRLALGWTGSGRDATTVHVRVAGERIGNFRGTAGATEWGAVPEVGLTMRF